MKRREFIGLGMGFLTIGSLLPASALAQDKAKGGSSITDKDILKEGQPATIANYCENPEKQPNKACPGAKERPGKCGTCQFYNMDKSETTFKGTKYARCQLLADPSKPRFVAEKAWCATYVKKA